MLGKPAAVSSIDPVISARQLTDEQKQALADWAAAGASIAELQQQLKQQFGLGCTYMEARLLVLDLGIEILEPPHEEANPAPAEGVPSPPPAAAAAVSVTIDELALPGALVSGKVRFSDGQSGVWMLDQFGRPTLDPDTAGYRPTQEDIAEFQRQLTTLLQRQGF